MLESSLKHLNRHLKAAGIDAVARFEEAEDESVDDQVLFSTADGEGRYPVAIQISGRYVGLNVEHASDDPDDFSVTHGRLHRTEPDGPVIMEELAAALKANPAVRPVQAPAPR